MENVFNLLVRATAPHQKYIRGCALGWSWNVESDVPPTAPIIFTGELGVKNVQKLINNFAADCSISIKFTTDYDHVTLPQTFKVRGSKFKVIAWHNVLASEIVTEVSWPRIAWLSLNFVQTILSTAQHVIHVQGHKVKYSNRNNCAADCLISLKFGTEFDHGTASIYKCSRPKVKGQGYSIM